MEKKELTRAEILKILAEGEVISNVPIGQKNADKGDDDAPTSEAKS